MSTGYIIIILLVGVSVLLMLVLKFKLNAFIALLLTSILAGIMAGMPLNTIMQSIQTGMGSTLGFVAIVVGLGAILGQMLESSGGAHALANHLLQLFGKERAPWAMVITGFIVAIPVFLDVGLVILAPILYALSRDTNRTLLYYGIPLLAGLAVTHAFVPPTPGPIAVAEILNADLGWVIFFGILLGFPTAVIAGPVFGKFISSRIDVRPPKEFSDVATPSDHKNLPSLRLILILIGLPIALILLSTITSLLQSQQVISHSLITEMIIFLGHPFSALILATLLAIYFLGIKRGLGNEEILALSTKSLAPAGIIILITGAGGTLKQVLIDSGIGKIIAESMADVALPVILLAWILALIVRVTQGSATVAMITAAGIIAPVISMFDLNGPHTALVVIAIASGASALSHVNDSGFWLVNRYFGMNEKQTLQSWTVMETIVGVCGLAFSLLASLFV